MDNERAKWGARTLHWEINAADFTGFNDYRYRRSRGGGWRGLAGDKGVCFWRGMEASPPSSRVIAHCTREWRPYGWRVYRFAWLPVRWADHDRLCLCMSVWLFIGGARCPPLTESSNTQIWLFGVNRALNLTRKLRSRTIFCAVLVDEPRAGLTCWRI